MDSEEDDAKVSKEDGKEEPDLEGEKQAETCSKTKGGLVADTEEKDTKRQRKALTLSDTHWEGLRGSFIPSQSDAASVLIATDSCYCPMLCCWTLKSFYPESLH